jgi:hypothetical protein
MSDREILVRWLATVASRLRWSAAVRELGALACGLLALAFLWQSLAAAGVPGPVRSALLPLLILAALTWSALFAWRMTRPATLAQAAAEADVRGGLSDEIKTAHWFAASAPAAGRGRAEALVELLLARAARTAQRLDSRRVVPLRVPRSALAALALAGATWGLTFLPGSVLPVAPLQATSSAQASVARAAVASTDASIVPLPNPPEASHEGEQSAQPGEPASAPMGSAAGDEPGKSEVEAAHAARLSGEAAQARPGNASQMTGLPPGLSIAAVLQASADDAQQDEAVEQQGGSGAQVRSGSLSTPMARMSREMRNQIREERRKLGGTPAQGDVQYSPRMRGMRRNSGATDQLVDAQGQATDAGAQDSVDGEAVGSPEGQAKAGGTSGEHPESSQVTELDSQPVLGERTPALPVQAEHVRVDRADERPAGAAKESFYAATRRRAAQAGYQAVDAQARKQREQALAPGDTPLPYREAVKRYFLAQHAR